MNIFGWKAETKKTEDVAAAAMEKVSQSREALEKASERLQSIVKGSIEDTFDRLLDENARLTGRKREQ